jgi:hypothetical protein
MSAVSEVFRRQFYGPFAEFAQEKKDSCSKFRKKIAI